MTRVLLTGGSGFIATHVLSVLLQRGHSVVTTVRSQEKANNIQQANPGFGKDKLDFVIVEDIAVEGAFDDAVKSTPPFEAVIHTASPFHFNVTDVQKQLLDPAVIGTAGILKSIKKNAPSVKRVVITSSFAAIMDMSKGNWPEHTYSEADWNPMTHEQALMNAAFGYTASKLFAERAAWDFVKEEQPNFNIATLAPPFVFGPVMHNLSSMAALNTSNQVIAAFVMGKCKSGIPPTTAFIWTDVRDLALGHVLAMEKEEAGGKRFFFTSGHFANKELAAIIRNNFPEYEDKLPPAEDQGGDFPAEGVYKIDNSQTKQVLGIEFTSFEKCIVDTVKSFKSLGA
ncbi:putative nadph-dependent methylglyoxal reductase gre2 protein [Neofusicoccum parvum UCRNP2]|uniref:Putative nadph-dependent methylglyoxal reductase gre2 protein n=1 Tax=Botryosphaeria parva (strain UCR-NP2) TaxID=1287680 RepID=R1EEL8_BOTPV|nr:putative nadph-dependent methylglyoxal reductase gre2 protein [Neofusicoccum parvum UCRNP2]